jgi:hypothetical protein
MGAFALQFLINKNLNESIQKKIEEFGFEKNDTRGLAKQG